MTKKGKLFLFGLMITVAAGLWWYTFSSAVSVLTKPVLYGDMYDRFEEAGEVVPKSEIFIFAPATGRVSSLPDSGDIVALGDTLCLIEKDDAQAQSQILALEAQRLEILALENASYLGLDGASLSVEQALRQVELADKAVLDFTALFDAGVVTKAELDAVVQLSKDAKTALDASRIAATPSYPDGYFNSLRNIIDRQIILIDDLYGTSGSVAVTAPIAGVVRLTEVLDGQFVPKETPLFSIWARDDLKLVCSILAEDAARIRPGDIVEVDFSGFGKCKGLITSVSAEAGLAVSSVGLMERRVDITIVPDFFPDGVGAGYPVDITYSPLVAANILSVTSSAILPDSEGYAVYAVSNGRAVLTAVEVGLRASGRAEIVAGLSDGDVVISDPYADGIKDGVKVNID